MICQAFTVGNKKNNFFLIYAKKSLIILKCDYKK